MGQGLVTERQAAACERRLSFTESYQDLADVEIVFECVTEKLAVKYEVYRQIEANCPHLKAIASTTSAISPADLAKGVATREKVMVAHPSQSAPHRPLRGTGEERLYRPRGAGRLSQPCWNTAVGRYAG